MEARIFELLLQKLKDEGLLGAGERQRTDSTHVLAAVRSLNRLELAGEALRAALEALAAAAPDWLATVIDPSWAERYGARIDTLHLPSSETKKRELAVSYGRDGYLLLDAVTAPGAPSWLTELPAVQALRRIWVQQYYRSIDGRGGQEVIRREPQDKGLPPGRARIVSPYDLEARYSEKRGTGWDGYKAHFSETCHEPQADGTQPAPNLISMVATTTATVPDVAMTESIHNQLDEYDLAPGEHVVDAGYTSAELLLAARARGITLIGPGLADTSVQARTGGYTAGAFDIDWQNEQATCPQGKTSTSWSPGTQRGTQAIVVRFAVADCRDCPVRDRCTTAKGRGRQISLRPREIHEAVQAARAEQTTEEWARRYRIRSGVEGTMRQATHVTGVRRARYKGLAKTRLEHATAATAINLIRLDAWWTGHPLDRTRTTHLQRLHFTLAA
jgi:hypothetical protein